jgi:DNA-directed RNA polymerase specialized sigma24 family protein
LSAAIDQLKNRPCHDPFGPASALREVIKAAIARNDSFIEQDFEQQAGIAIQRWHSGPLPLEALPWAERAVYFLHEVLHYARRDTSLLLGINDGEVSLLARAAKKRMGHPEDPPKREFCRQTPRTSTIRVRHSIAFAAYE